MNENGPVVETRHLTKRFGSLTAVDDVSFAVGRGQILGFIGPNGAGKTTTIKILVGLMRPTAGSARVAGADCVREARRIKRMVGYMPDNFGYYENMRVREYLDFFGAAFGLPRGRRVRRIDEVMEMTGSGFMRDRYVESLSHGMKQRVGLARTLLHDPEVLILDEPANGLDPEARIEMRAILLKLAAMGKTLLVTSHILPELARLCDQVAILSQGKLRAFGPLPDIMRDVSHRRLLEVQLASGQQVGRAGQLIRGAVGPGNEVVESAAEAVVRFHTDGPEDAMADLLRQLIDGGVPVVQFREVQTDLEDAFLSVTRGEAAAGQAEAAVTASDSSTARDGAPGGPG